MSLGEIKNATIERVFLGREDHGILTAYVYLNYGGSGQGFGGWDLRFADRCGDFVIGVMDALEANDWKNLVGKNCRVRVEDGLAKSIGHIVKEQWFTPEKDLRLRTK